MIQVCRNSRQALSGGLLSKPHILVTKCLDTMIDTMQNQSICIHFLIKTSASDTCKFRSNTLVEKLFLEFVGNMKISSNKNGLKFIFS